MNIRTAVLAIALATVFTGAATAQVVGYNFRTGDAWVDTELGYMNDYGRNHRDYFIDDVVSSFGAPRYLVNDLLTTQRWAPGDVYYACALAYQAHVPCSDVVRTHGKDRGQGWGVVAMRMGIKPGSAQFHALKGQVGKSNGKFKTKSSTRVDGPGNSGKSKSKVDDGSHGHSDKGHDNDGGQGNSGKDKGNSGKGKDKSKGGGH